MFPTSEVDCQGYGFSHLYNHCIVVYLDSFDNSTVEVAVDIGLTVEGIFDGSIIDAYELNNQMPTPNIL